MPAKASWCSKINEIIADLEKLPIPFVDRSIIESLLGVGKRRAQQILEPCITIHIGLNGLADRDRFIAHLRRLADGEDVFYELARRRDTASILEALRKDRIEHPRLLVEAPTRIVSQEFADLPAGVNVEPGCITVAFDEPKEALEKLLALAMAISNDFAGFEGKTRSVKSLKAAAAPMGV